MRYERTTSDGDAPEPLTRREKKVLLWGWVGFFAFLGLWALPAWAVPVPGNPGCETYEEGVQSIIPEGGQIEVFKLTPEETAAFMAEAPPAVKAVTDTIIFVIGSQPDPRKGMLFYYDRDGCVSGGFGVPVEGLLLLAMQHSGRWETVKHIPKGVDL